MSYGKIYETTYWGVGINNTIGWGSIYANLASEVPALLSALQARATYFENAAGTTTILNNFKNCEV